jgi:putative PEP-CTERM system histidine kinase
MVELSMSGLALVIPYLACALAYAVLTALILAQVRRSRTGLLLAVATGATTAWAVAVAVFGAPLQGVAGALDLLRILAWYGFCLYLYRRTLPGGSGERLFTTLGLVGVAIVVAALLTGHADASGTVSLFTPALFLRLALAIGQLLLLENLYRRTAPERSWHMGLACIALGGLAAYDVAVCADAVLLHTTASALVAGRALAAALVTPLLAVAAARNRNWQVDIHVSRSVALHTATLVISGMFLVALAAVGELALYFGAPLSGWGGLVEIGLVFSGVVGAAVLLTSGSARGRLRGALVDHFFTHRYDYRREWQRCINTFAAAAPAPTRAGDLSRRVIRAVADAVDSPAGLLFTCEPGQAGLSWAGAWNVPPAPALPAHSSVAQAILAAEAPLLLTPQADQATPVFPPSFDPWLAVPLEDSPRSGSRLGCIVLARPRAAFALDDEVQDLLRILAHEVAIHLAQERAATALLQTHDLRTYGERFAFVAHDIKNVSSQLQLLLANAEVHLGDPAFQHDMLATVRASVSRIDGLIRRLEPAREPGERVPLAALDPAPQLETLVTARRRAGWVQLGLAPDSLGAGAATIGMDAAAFQAAVTHLLDNAAAAAGITGTVRVALLVTGERVVIDIADDGPGMTPEFIRDELFTPFATRTIGGSGLGAFQARELLRAAGGDITVLSQPGVGTTMRLSWPLAAPTIGPCTTSADGITRRLTTGASA